ncbi:GNAT family N-acetyltransferase [Azospirillum agricola]|uniref:GNAT family N-acetyltransferase n=1 Tax=Azospirillum agricola TaxID=1720247 RepID=UPI000A0F38FF|nr:GNAT family N-acetyltransferase [Azospirillum agricola]SMH52454.1 Acetyltransferase (GNAT) family protein [Azospirillum lipoferum]
MSHSTHAMVLAGPLPRGAAARAIAGARLPALAAELPDDLTVRMLDPDDHDRLADFRVRVVATLDDPDHYRMAGEVGNFVADHLGERGVTAGIFHGGRLVAYGALGLPGPEDPNRGRDLDLPEDALALVAHMSSAMVDPAERGRGLHHRLIGWRLEVAEALGRRHLLTTVSPRNHRSWGHLAGHGLHPRRLVRAGGDLVRLLVHRDLARTPVFDTGTAALVAVEELAGRPDLFERGGRVWARVAAGEGAERRWFALCGLPV